MDVEITPESAAESDRVEGDGDEAVVDADAGDVAAAARGEHGPAHAAGGLAETAGVVAAVQEGAKAGVVGEGAAEQAGDLEGGSVGDRGDGEIAGHGAASGRGRGASSGGGITRGVLADERGQLAGVSRSAAFLDVDKVTYA